MNRFRNCLFAAVGFLALVGLLVLTGSNTGHSDNPDDVRVINRLSEPVPIVGVARVFGSVAIANTPTVGLDPSRNQVQVANSVMIRNLDEPASNPFLEQLNITVPDQAYTASASLLLPAGKEFAIEYISANAAAPAGQTVGLIEVGIIDMNSPKQGPETTPSFSLAPFRQGVLGGGSNTPFDLFVANQLTKIYAGGGDTLTITVHRAGDSSGQGAITARVTLSGYCIIDMN